MSGLKTTVFIAAAAAALSSTPGSSASPAQPKPLDVIPCRVEGTAGRMLAVQVSVNGAAPRWFAIDTGATHTVLDARTAEALGLRAQSVSQEGGTGQGAVPAGQIGR